MTEDEALALSANFVGVVATAKNALERPIYDEIGEQDLERLAPPTVKSIILEMPDYVGPMGLLEAISLSKRLSCFMGNLGRKSMIIPWEDRYPQFTNGEIFRTDWVVYPGEKI